MFHVKHSPVWGACQELWQSAPTGPELRPWSQAGLLLEEYSGLLLKAAPGRRLLSRSQQNLEAIWLHILDSLQVLRLPLQSGQRVVDAGSGNGLPGIPLAVAWPAREVVLADRSGSRCAFLEFVTARLRLQNVRVVEANLDSAALAREAPAVILVRALVKAGDLDRIAARGFEAANELAVFATAKNASEWLAQAAGLDLQLVQRHDYTLPGSGPGRVLLKFAAR